MVGDHHELGEGGSSQDGVVGGLELGDLEVDVLCAVIVACAEGDRQGGLADWSQPGSKDDAVEGLVRWHQGSHVVAHALQCAGEDDVEGAATVDEYFGQADLAHHRANHEGVGTRPGQVYPVVVAVEGDRRLRPPQGFNRVFEHQVDFVIIQLELVPA